MGVVTNDKIIKLTSRMANEFRPELDELIIRATEEHVRSSGWDGSIRDLHNTHLAEQVSAAFVHLAADLIGVFERYDALTEQTDLPPDVGASTS